MAFHMSTYVSAKQFAAGLVDTLSSLKKYQANRIFIRMVISVNARSAQPLSPQYVPSYISLFQ